MRLPRKNESTCVRAGNTQVITILVLVLFAVLAIATAVGIALGDYQNTLMFVGVVLAIAYFTTLWKWTWVLAMFLALAGFSIAPTGFVIPSSFLGAACAGAMAVAILARKTLGGANVVNVEALGPSFRWVVRLMWIWFLYLVAHAMASTAFPVYASDYSHANALKAYAEHFAPLLTVLFLYYMRHWMPQWVAFRRMVTIILFFTIVALVAHRLYLISQGFMEQEGLTDVGAVVIPGINLMPGLYTLRVLSPVTALWATALLLSKHEKLTVKRSIACLLLFALALLGALISGGRATPIITIVAAMGVAFIYRRIGLSFVPVVGLLCLMFVVNILPSHVTNRLPMATQRTIELLRLEKTSVSGDIDNSTYMRRFVFEEGVKEWLSSTRIFLTGRGVRSFVAYDAEFRRDRSASMEERWMIAVRTGRVHRTVGNIMIRYGLCGLVIYYSCQIAIVIYSYRAFKWMWMMRKREVAAAAVLLGLVTMHLVLGLVMDLDFSVSTAWILVIVHGFFVKYAAEVAAKRKEVVAEDGERIPSEEVRMANGVGVPRALS